MINQTREAIRLWSHFASEAGLNVVENSRIKKLLVTLEKYSFRALQT